MHKNTTFGSLLFVVGLFTFPYLAHAAIPFFGHIIPDAYNTCPAGWGAVLNIINNIISFLITIAIVFVAPVMIAYGGFLLVINPMNPGGKAKAKDIITSTIVGIVIALSAWLIVDAVMAILYHPNPDTKWTTTWSQLVTSGGVEYCIQQAGALPGEGLAQVAPGVTVTPVTPVTGCPAPLSALTDPLALQMEGGQSIIWTNTDPRLHACVNKFVSKVGGTVTSAYRPQAYQTHLWEIQDRWCTQGLKSNSTPTCSSLKSTVSAEVAKHFGTSSWNCGSVAKTASTHGSGVGVDISGLSQSAAVQQVAAQSCLIFANYPADPYHYNLKAGCTCQ